MNNKQWTMNMKVEKEDKDNQAKPCCQCEGKGYTEIRDCAGEIQRTETCSFCEGKGYTSQYVD